MVTATQYAQRTRKRRVWIIPAAVCAAGVVLAIGTWFVVISPILSGDAQPGAFLPNSADPDRAAVHRWIDENANDGDWEEVRWWPAVMDDGLKTCRIKWRDTSPMGWPILNDWVIWWQPDGDMVIATPKNDWQIVHEKMVEKHFED